MRARNTRMGNRQESLIKPRGRCRQPASDPTTKALFARVGLFANEVADEVRAFAQSPWRRHYARRVIGAWPRRVSMAAVAAKNAKKLPQRTQRKGGRYDSEKCGVRSCRDDVSRTKPGSVPHRLCPNRGAFGRCKPRAKLHLAAKATV